MRNIRELLEKEECVWLFLENDAVCDEFFEEADKNGFSFRDLPREKWVRGKFIALHADGRMGHLPLFIWYETINSHRRIEGSKPCIDYRRFKAGEADYDCREANLSALKRG